MFLLFSYFLPTYLNLDRVLRVIESLTILFLLNLLANQWIPHCINSKRSVVRGFKSCMVEDNR